MRLLISALIVALLLTACRRQEEPAAAPVRSAPVAATTPATPLLRDGIAAVLVESATEALPLWRRYQGQAPPLVLLARTPLLVPVPQELRAASLELVQSGEPDELARRGTPLTADPLFFPEMAVRLALEAGFFSRLVWIFPSRAAVEELSLDLFRQQLLDSGMVTPPEAASLTLQNGQFSGTVAGRPFLACHPTRLPAITEPILLHLDLSYVQPLYQGEVKTPLYPLLGSILAPLREREWPTLAVTLAAANHAGGVPVTSRFLHGDLAAIFRHPEYLTEAMPEAWAQRAQALYLANFFQKEEVRDIYLAMERDAPGDASIKHALFSITRQFKDGDSSLEYLRQAVALDRIYAMGYLTLATEAREKNLPRQVVRMLELARAALPDNPFITLHLAQMQREIGNDAAADELFASLRPLPWSAIYYSDLPALLR